MQSLVEGCLPAAKAKLLLQVSAVVALLVAIADLAADDKRAADEAPPPKQAAEKSPQPWREWLGKKTLGGVVLWGDQLFFHDCRIQQNVWTGHYRLLDGDNQQLASGTLDQCKQELARHRKRQKLPPMSGRAVLMLHGLGGVRLTMQLVAGELERQGYHVFNVTYPSTRANLQQHAQALASIVEHLDGVEEINFVGHSMGNLVIRRYLGLCEQADSHHKLDPRLKRIVMIAPPNHGAELARAWGDNTLFVTIAGESAFELGAGWPGVEKHLATPQCQFGIIAGGLGDDRGFSKELPGDDDGLLTVATTRLAGAADFAVLPHRHNLLLVDSTVSEYTARFLKDGYFRTAQDRQPIPVDRPRQAPAPPK